MPKQIFTQNTRNDMVGNLYGMSYSSSVRHTFSNMADDMDAVEGIPYGRVIQQGEEEKWATLGLDASVNDDIVFGICIRQHAHEANYRPSTGETEIPAGFDGARLMDGFMTVEVENLPTIGGATPSRVFVDTVTGEFASDAGDLDNPSEAIRNCKWHYTNPNDGVWDRPTENGLSTAVVEISSAPMYA